MVSHIKKVIEKLFSKEAKFKSADNCWITRPDLIHPTASIANSTLGGEIIVSEGVVIESAHLEGVISIGRYSTIYGPHANIFCRVNPVSIGKFCSIASHVAIQEYNHDSSKATTYFIFEHIIDPSIKANIEIVSKGPIKIGNDVWIGTQSVITSGVVIGDGAVIGANSVVTSAIPPYAIVAGVPAKVVRYRFEKQIIERLLHLKWWDWEVQRIRKNKEFFSDSLSLAKFDGIE